MGEPSKERRLQHRRTEPDVDMQVRDGACSNATLTCVPTRSDSTPDLTTRSRLDRPPIVTNALPRLGHGVAGVALSNVEGESRVSVRVEGRAGVTLWLMFTSLSASRRGPVLRLAGSLRFAFRLAGCVLALAAGASGVIGIWGARGRRGAVCHYSRSGGLV
jgi:hypothetical protein